MPSPAMLSKAILFKPGACWEVGFHGRTGQPQQVPQGKAAPRGQPPRDEQSREIWQEQGAYGAREAGAAPRADLARRQETGIGRRRTHLTVGAPVGFVVPSGREEFCLARAFRTISGLCRGSSGS